MKPNRRARIADAKAKRQKITIIAGSSILALVLAIQVPKMMSLLSPGGAQASAASQESTPATTEAASTSTGAPSAAAPAAPAPATIAATVDAPAKAPTFDAFASKDPFAPQLTTTQRRAAASSDTSGGGTSAPGSGAGLAPASAPTPSSSLSDAAGQPPAPAAAVISVNGVPATVAVGATFPTADPVFRLLKLGPKVAKIAIAEGSYTSGAKAVSLALHGSVTLLNTATGARYRLQFVSVAL